MFRIPELASDRVRVILAGRVSVSRLENVGPRADPGRRPPAAARVDVALDADLAPGHPVPQPVALERLRLGAGELPALDGGEPKAELVGKVVAGAPGAAARPEVLQAGAGAGERLAAALRPCASVLKI